VWQGIADSIGASDHANPLHDGRAGPGEPGSPVAPSVVVPFAEPARARSRRRLQFGLIAAAVSLIVAATAGGVVGYLLGAGDDPDDIGGLALDASDDPNGVVATLTDQSDRAVARVVSDEDGSYMLLEGLETLPEGRAYQLWSMTDEEPVSLGMLGREGTNTVAFRLPPTITELAISVERTSGDVAPTTELLASGAVSRS
jgi:anti-sigma-K factor RskA